MRRQRWLRSSFLLTSLIGWPMPDLHARWDHRNARELNRYEALGVEFYNDLLSYRAPWTWQERKISSQFHYETGAGSLNQRDFFYEQRFAFATRPEEPWGLQYQREQYEDPRQISDQNQVELRYTPTEAWRFGLLAEGTTDKAYMDLGWSTRYGSALASYVQVDVWWVDGYFQDKKPERQDTRTGDPWALHLRSRYHSESIVLHANFTRESPLTWRLAEQDRVYRAAREHTHVLLEHPQGPETYYLEWRHEWLKESLGRSSQVQLPGYTVYEDTLEVGHKLRQGPTRRQWALWLLNQDIAYRGIDSDPTQGFPRRRPGLPELKRREFAALVNWHQALSPGSPHALQWGFVGNQVAIHEARLETSSEVKLVLAFDWALSSQAQMLFGTTWDLDQIARSLLYRSQALRPWGGGYMQIMATL